MRVGQPSFVATRPNQQWAIDFVHDRMANGRTLRILSVVHTFTRKCLALEVDTCLPSRRRVTRTLDSVIAERGKPERIRMDNGAELTSRHFLAWGIEQHIELVHIQPGKPVQNAHVESFNRRFRDECLNTNGFEAYGTPDGRSPPGETNSTWNDRTAGWLTAPHINSLRRALQPLLRLLHNEATTGRKKRVQVSPIIASASIADQVFAAGTAIELVVQSSDRRTSDAGTAGSRVT